MVKDTLRSKKNAEEIYLTPFDLNNSNKRKEKRTDERGKKFKKKL